VIGIVVSAFHSTVADGAEEDGIILGWASFHHSRILINCAAYLKKLSFLIIAFLPDLTIFWFRASIVF
jgi:hypothetical protein